MYNLNGIPLAHLVFSKITESYANADELKKIKAIRDYICETHYDAIKIFGELGDSGSKSDDDAIINKIDTIVTSLGPSGDLLLAHLDRWFPNMEEIPLNKYAGKVDSIDKRRLASEIAIGDIAGILLPRPDANYERNRIITDQVNTYLATLRPSHLRNLREKTKAAHKQYNDSELPESKKTVPPAGVVLVVRQEQNIDAMLAAMAEGYVSRLVISYDAEKAVLGRISKLKDRGEEITLANLIHA